MDPLSDFTALSPHANAMSLASGRDDSEEVTSQQCSADPNAFAGLQRPLGVVVASHATSFLRAGSGSLRVSLDVGAGGASQMSQPGSQFHDALLEDSQLDDEAALSPPPLQKMTDDVPKAVRAPQKEGGGGFLLSLERRFYKNATRRDCESEGADRTVGSRASDEDVDEEEAMDAGTSGDGFEREVETMSPVTCTGSMDLVSRSADAHGGRRDDERGKGSSAVNGDTESDAGDAVRSDTDSEYDAYRRDSMDSIPETQAFDEYEGMDDEQPAESFPSTEVLSDTVDQAEAAPAAPAASVLEREGDAPLGGRNPPVTPPNESTTTSSVVEASVGRKTQYLKRKQKAKVTLQHDPDAFVDTEDQTLAQLAERVRRERETQIRAVKSLTSPQQNLHRQQHQDDSQEELTPTQPSKSTLEGVVHVALKKRGKAHPASAPELSASQEKAYEFVDSACRCGEAICVCDGVSPRLKPSARPSSAIRNLEFSFAIPSSQDSESQSQLQDSLPDASALALKTLQAAQAVQQSKKSASSIPSSVSRVDNRDDAEVLEATPKKATKAKDSSPLSVAATPPSGRKRGRKLFSPDAGAISQSREVTPRKSSRTDKPPTAPTTALGSSTPSVRTRTRIQSPVPSATRSYSSRSKTLFKSARHFCLTGFTGDGLENLRNLIEDYGGKICQQDALLKENNTKVVVIATPISWRKLKFMCAIACGIPVVHPGWIHACIKASSVIPFDGYCVPSGFSTITGRFECLPVKELDVFKALRFGIPYDVSPLQLESTKEMSSLIAFILRECGAQAVYEVIRPCSFTIRVGLIHSHP
jgi:hypothetical protein